MKILLEELQHQTEALEAIINSFKGITYEHGKLDNPYANVLVNDAYDDKTNIDIKMETGERVIIVMGAVNVMKPRVSGTLNKYILCIA